MIRFAALALLTGCLSTLGPEVGPRQFVACTDVDSDPAVAISFERDIRTGIFARADVHCVQCHTPGGATPIGIQIGGLDLSSYATMRHGGVQSGANVVLDGAPCTSILVEKIGTAPPFGARMPYDGPPYLAATDAQTIIDWIAEGAHDN